MSNLKAKNIFKEKILAGEKTIGTFCELMSENVVEALGYAGLDYVVFDNEHSPIEAETNLALVRAAEHGGITPFARVKGISRPALLKLLDIGVQGLIVPNVKTVDDVNQLVSWSKYAPIGNRGFSASRKDGWGYMLNMSIQDTMEFFNEQVLLIPQCETIEALESIEEITAINGVDGIFVGPYDLSIAMGIPGEFSNPKFVAALDRIIRACRKAGKFTMIFTANQQAAIDYLNNGFDSVSYYMDAAFLIDGCRSKMNAVRDGIKKAEE
ncbi:MAG: hypothetical protein E7568_04115 [Ruminococcaceae bacterium]|nr:hypothetical protein [Oscillospiraceae bacterium]